jgi:hypothetical protein
MKISAEELEENGYKLADKLEFAELMPFLTPYLKKGNLAMVGFVFSNFLCVAASAFYFILNIKSHAVEIGSAAGYYFLGFVLAFGLIPLHEYLHALAYKAVGAKNVAYDVNLKKMIFLTIAHKFVATKKEFTFVALVPFVFISALLLGLLPLANLNWQFTILGALFMHTSCCIGDFGLLSYFLANKNRQLVTYDNKELKVSFFYELVKQ